MIKSAREATGRRHATALVGAVLLLVVSLAQGKGGGTGIDGWPGAMPVPPRPIQPPTQPMAPHSQPPSDTTEDQYRPDQNPQFSKGDSNCDGKVDFEDLDAFLAALIDEVTWKWLRKNPVCKYLEVNDFDEDGRVTWIDFELLLARLAEQT